MAISEAQRLRGLKIHNKNKLVLNEGARMVINSTEEPPARAGVFSEGYDKWENGRTYIRNEVFVYNGCVGFCKQPTLVASDVYPPFSAGTEALYGVRPIPDENGVYPYTYNMKAEVGMKVREGDKVYICIQGIETMIYAPSQIPAHFNEFIEK